MQDLVRDLDAEFARDPAGPGVARLLESFAVSDRDWRAYAHYCEGPYARNLVHACERYELMVICWNGGEASPIHDHAGQRCWMGALEGEIKETLFEFPEEGCDAGAAGAPLVVRSSRILHRGEVSFITDDIALHEIRTAANQRAASLHLYSSAIRTCRLFDPATGAIEERCLSYHSIEGQLQAC